MDWNRRDFLKAALLLPAGAYLARFQALAAPHVGMIKITAIKTLGLDNLGDGCLIRIETDAGLVGYGESGVTAKMARARIENIQGVLLGQDPLAIARHFHLMIDQQHPFMGNIPTISGIDIALWDLAGKILDEPLYRLLGGPMRLAAPIYSGAAPRNILDVGECRAWAQRVREAPEGFRAFKVDITCAGVARRLPFAETLDGSDFKKVATGFQNVRTALGDDLDIAMHCHSQLDTRSAMGACKAIEPIDPMWVEDPLNVPYSEGWQELRRATRVPLLTGEKLELVRGFRPFLDHGTVDIVHPDVAYAGGITGCMKIADYAALTRTPVALHGGGSSLVRFYASVHLAGAIQHFFKIENVYGMEMQKMAADKGPLIRKSVMQFPEGPGLGLNINEDWLRQHMAKGETWWG
ncbi:MAG: mandelate racemase/muconate lactonizing enzyme family protein [Terriglobia bacterium]